MKERNIVTSVILCFITCWIYQLYWGFAAAREILTFKDYKDESKLEAVLMIVLPPLGIYLTEKKFIEACAAKEIPHKNNTILYLIISLLGLHFVSLAMLQSEMNKMANE